MTLHSAGRKAIVPAQANDSDAEASKDEAGKPPALKLSGLDFFFADISRKVIVWHETGSQTFDSQIQDLQEAPSQEALRLLTPEDRKTILRLIQGAIRDGVAGPYDVGGGVDHRIPGIPLMAYRYELPDGRMLAVCFPSIGKDDSNPGKVALGLGPILQHFVASSNRIVLLIDSFGYIRYASEGFLQSFGVQDASLVMGRNIAHVQKRVGRSLVSLAVESLTRRASATGRAKFLLVTGDTLELTYSAMYFRIGGAVGGVLFSAGHVGGDVDFAKVFNLCSAPMLIVNIKSRMILAANNAAMKTYHLTQSVIEDKPITETLLHPSSFIHLLKSAEEGTDVPQSVVVNSLNGQSKKKRMKVSILDADKAPKLVLEARA
ncbi:hypothetical protein [Roseibium suaedae]|uniref:PAS domain-containing protein n=1 Tax=Roseibium suaedae TaxID=735517 RepID=A0A1M7HHR2_9HYPH|nr:hypothetical protein [Roseibium suaedae]SHM27989.1 hypothetical protein SAMN05444272_2229 [Roseibium suaedae]